MHTCIQSNLQDEEYVWEEMSYSKLGGECRGELLGGIVLKSVLHSGSSRWQRNHWKSFVWIGNNILF